MKQEFTPVTPEFLAKFPWLWRTHPFWGHDDLARELKAKSFEQFNPYEILRHALIQSVAIYAFVKHEKGHSVWGPLEHMDRTMLGTKSFHSQYRHVGAMLTAKTCKWVKEIEYFCVVEELLGGTKRVTVYSPPEGQTDFLSLLEQVPGPQPTEQVA